MLPWVCTPFSSQAVTVNTGNYTGTNSSAVPLTANNYATPRSIIRLDLGGAKYPNSGGELTIAITVDTTTPVVTTGTAADQAFRDDSVGAAFFGYYLTLGLRSSAQTTASISVSARRGSPSTVGRTFGIIGNGTTIPTAESDLTLVPDAYIDFAFVPSNTISCGPNHVANGLSGAAINCATGTNVPELDVTQFVKVNFTDTPGVPISSKIEFIASAI